LLDLIVTLVTGQIGANLRRYVRLAVFAAVTLVLAAVALAAGAVAAYSALDAALGPVKAALVVAAVAAILAGLASIPLWRKPAPPPPSAAATLAHLVVAVALGLLAERKTKKDAA
jgi:drug/metabolite transporter (DMT)-like permease